MAEAFLYTVKPRKTIIGLSGDKPIRTNKSLYLTKDDVYICLKNATVYRRFANDNIIERVTIDNVERVHRENYIPEDKWDEFCADEKSKGYGEVIAPDNLDILVSQESKHLEEDIVETNCNDSIDNTEYEEVTSNIDSNIEIQDDNDDITVESDDDTDIEKSEE